MRKSNTEGDFVMDTVKWCITLYFVIINIISVIITVYDKRAARKHKRRVPEKELMMFSVLGGSLCMYITMITIRHKTKHPKFMIGIPLIFVLEMLVFAAVYFFSVS